MTEAIPELDRQMERSLRGLHRARWYGVTVLALVVLLAIGYGVWVIRIQQQRLTASCQFYQLIATLPVPAKPMPSREGTELVLDSRSAYLRQGCGQLPPAGHELRHWAAFYHIPLQ